MIAARPNTRSRQPRWRRSRRFNIFVITTLIVSAILIGLAVLQRDARAPTGPDSLENESIATFVLFDVGQALSAGIVTNDGHGMIYDFGVRGSDIHETIIPFFDEHGVDELDYAILSHPHQDHIGGLPQLLDAIPISLYIDPVLETTNQTYAHSLERIEALEIETAIAQQGDSYSLGEHVELEILWPAGNLLTDADDEVRMNDNSTVVRVDIGDVSFLLTGDIERDAEDILVETLAESIDVDVLLVGHHGSNTSSQTHFLQAASPSLAAISAGIDNPYGHPHTEVMQRLRQDDIRIFRTDVDGAVIIQTDGESWDVSTTRTSQSWSNPTLLQPWIESNTTTSKTSSQFWYSTTPSN